MRSRWLGFILTGLAVIVSIWAWPRLPPQVPTHWNLQGQPDGYSSRLFAALLSPVILLVASALLQVLPKIDPKRENFPKYSEAYWVIVNAILMFLFAIHVAIIGNGIGAPVSMGILVPVGMGLLFVVMGVMMGDIEPNWFLGIRTPWTLESETVWRKTHETAGRLFVVAGLVIIVLGFFPRVSTIIVIGAVIAIAAVVPVVQSYLLWKKEQDAASQRGPRVP